MQLISPSTSLELESKLLRDAVEFGTEELILEESRVKLRAICPSTELDDDFSAHSGKILSVLAITKSLGLSETLSSSLGRLRDKLDELSCHIRFAFLIGVEQQNNVALLATSEYCLVSLAPNPSKGLSSLSVSDIRPLFVDCSGCSAIACQRLNINVIKRGHGLH